MNDDTISRAAAIDAVINSMLTAAVLMGESPKGSVEIHEAIKNLKDLPSAQPYALDEWCDTCKEYDSERHCCQRYNRVIRDAVKMRKRGTWITKSTNGEMFDCCSVCGYVEWDNPKNFCPNCGADMRGGEE